MGWRHSCQKLSVTPPSITLQTLANYTFTFSWPKLVTSTFCFTQFLCSGHRLTLRVEKKIQPWDPVSCHYCSLFKPSHHQNHTFSSRVLCTAGRKQFPPKINGILLSVSINCSLFRPWLSLELFIFPGVFIAYVFFSKRIMFYFFICLLLRYLFDTHFARQHSENKYADKTGPSPWVPALPFMVPVAKILPKQGQPLKLVVFWDMAG